MNRAEVAMQLPDADARRFFLADKTPVYIVTDELSARPNHTQIAEALKREGVFAIDARVIGGYCTAFHALPDILHTAEPIGQFPGANAETFENATNTYGVELIPLPSIDP